MSSPQSHPAQMDQFHRFSQLSIELQQKIWEFAAVEAHGGARVFHLNFEAETKQFVEQRTVTGAVRYQERHGPLLSFTPQFKAETKDSRALLMACRDSRYVYLSMYPDRINFTRPPRLGEDPFGYLTPSLQYALYMDSDVDIICLSISCLCRARLTMHERYYQLWVRDNGRPSLNWPVWDEVKNIGVDITNPQHSLHSSGKAMNATLFSAIDNIIYSQFSYGPETRVFMINFGPIEYDADGQPIGLVLDKDMPEYSSTMPGLTPGNSSVLVVGGMWLLLDEAMVLRHPFSNVPWGLHGPVPVGKAPRLLVRSSNGKKMLPVQAADMPEDDTDDSTSYDSDDSEDE